MSGIVKKILIVMLLVPSVAFAAGAPSSVFRSSTDGFISPLIKTDFVKGLYFLATSTSQASTFPYASTTVTSANRFCLTSDICISAWPSSTGASFSTTSTDYWKTQRDFFSTSTTDYYLSQKNLFSTTSADFWKTQQNFFATTSADFYVNASTTIPKTYTANTYSNALQTIPYASSTAITVPTLYASGLSAARIPYTSTGGLFLSTASLQFNDVANRLTVTNASSTALTADNFFSTNASSTNLSASTGLSVNGSFNVNSGGTITRLGNVSVNLTGTALQLSSSASNLIIQNNAGGTSGSGIDLQTGTAADWSTLIKFTAGGQERARFTGNGLFGFGTTSPFALFSIQTNVLSTTTTLFAIASTTANATTTLFSVSNTGAASTTLLYGAQLRTCSSGSFLTWTAGQFGCASTFAYLFNNGATTSRLYINGGLFASSTIQFGNTGLAQFFWDSAAGQLGVGTTSPRWPLTVSTTSRPQIGITDGSNTDGWAFRDAGNNFYLSSTSPLTFATTTPASFTILGGSSQGTSGNVGIASTTPWGRLSIGADLITTNPAFAISSSTAGMLFGINAQGGIYLRATQPATSTAIVFDWNSAGPQTEYLIGTSATTITIINATTSINWGSSRKIWICNPPATTAGALTWAGPEWIGTAPTQTTTAGQCDRYYFEVTRATSTTAYKVAGSSAAGFQ